MSIKECIPQLSEVSYKDLNALQTHEIYNDIGYKSTLFNEMQNGLTLDFLNGLNFSVSQGSENIYLEVACYDNSQNSFKEYKVKFYSKDNHEGMKSFIKSIIESL
jgi:hypothetical protein